MKSGRHSNPAAEPATEIVDVAAVARASAAADVLSATEQQVLHAAEVYRMVGRIETAQFMETVSGRIMAETYLKAKALIGEKGSIMVVNKAGRPETVSGMDAFCEAVMPVSSRRCRQIVAAIDTLGADLYQQAEQIGFKARDYQALRALPDDQQGVVKQAIESGDINAALDIVHDLAARNDAIKKKLADAEKTAKAKDKVIAKKDERLNQLLEAEERRHSADPAEAEQAQLDEVRDGALAAEMGIRRMMAAAARVVNEPASESTGLAARHAVAFAAQVFAQLINEAGIDVDFADLVTPHWLKPADGGTGA